MREFREYQGQNSVAAYEYEAPWNHENRQTILLNPEDWPRSGSRRIWAGSWRHRAVIPWSVDPQLDSYSIPYRHV